METLTLLGQYALSGLVLSSIIQLTKKWIQSKPGRIWWAVLLSVIGGVLVYGLQFIPGNYLEIIVGLWASANSVYLVLFGYLLKKKPA